MKETPPSRPAAVVAIVDDDASLRASAGMLVNSFGFSAVEFADAEDFLLWLQIGTADCLILDVLMPGINGLELQRHLQRIRPDLPIIFITAHAKEHEERQALDAGAVAVLRKPVADCTLLNTLRAALRPKQGGPPPSV